MQHYESELQTLFINTISGLKVSMKAIMKEQGLSLSPLHFMILKNIYETENCTANYLADVAAKDKGQVTRLIQEVINQGLIIKSPNPNDKRSQYLFLTDKGLTVYQHLAQADQKVLKEMRKDVSDEELKAFLNIGKKMLANLNTVISET